MQDQLEAAKTKAQELDKVCRIKSYSFLSKHAYQV